jgi:predicted dehydrogenase
MIKVGLIGYGYWGPNLVRNFSSTSNCIVEMVSDQRDERLEVVKKLYPNVKVSRNPLDIINDNNIDAVIIATPVFTHFELAKLAMEKNKHVLIEKPMTSTYEESQILLDMAVSKNLCLMVDHTFLYTSAVEKMKDLIDGNVLGKLNYFDSTRINLGLFQPDVNVLWDLAPHDLSILFHLISENPVSVNATGISHTNNGIENIAYLTMNFQSNFIAHINCSWSSPVKVRSTLVGGSEKMIMYNDLEPSDKIRLYDTSYSHKTDEEKKRILVDYRVGDIQIPKLSGKEALSGVASDFINSIINITVPLSNGILGQSVVKVLEASQKSLKANGKEIMI